MCDEGPITSDDWEDEVELCTGVYRCACVVGEDVGRADDVVLEAAVPLEEEAAKGCKNVLVGSCEYVPVRVRWRV